MATSITPRLQITTWSADADPFNRAQMNDSHTNLEARAGVFLSGVFASRPAAGPSNARGLFLATDQNAPVGVLYYSDGSNWHPLNQFGTPSALVVGGAGANGSATSVSRSDHVHPMPSYGLVGDIANVAAAKAAGVLDKFARADHVHQIAANTITGTMMVNGALDDERLFVTNTIPGTAIQPGSIPPSAFAASDVPSGAIMAYTLGTAPSGWLLCDGSAVSRSTYSTLFGVIGTTYGAGNGTTTFNLPDLRGRVPVGLDNMGGNDAGRLSAANTVGGTGGSEAVSLVTANLPSHSHTIDHNHDPVTSGAESGHSHSIDHNHAAVTSAAAGNHGHDITTMAGQTSGVPHNHGIGGYVAQAGDFIGSGFVGGATPVSVSPVGDHTHSVDLPNFVGTSGSSTGHTHSVDLPNFSGNSGNTGSGTAHDNMQPYILLSWIIKT